MWTLVPFRRYDPWTKTALNDLGAQQVQETGQPILWLAGWDRPTVNIGYGQDVSEQVDEAACHKDDVAIVRRQGGGGTTYLTPDGELTWGLFLPRDQAPEDLGAVYERYCGTLADALDQVGIDARHEPVNDIVTDTGKISGATAREDGDVLYVGGTLLYDIDPGQMFRYLTPDSDKLRDKPIDRFRDRVTSVTAESDAGFQDCITAVQEAFLADQEYEQAGWSDAVLRTAEERARIYRSDAWLYDRERDSE